MMLCVTQLVLIISKLEREPGKRWGVVGEETGWRLLYDSYCKGTKYMSRTRYMAGYHL